MEIPAPSGAGHRIRPRDESRHPGSIEGRDEGPLCIAAPSLPVFGIAIVKILFIILGLPKLTQFLGQTAYRGRMISETDFEEQEFVGIELDNESGSDCTFTGCTFQKCRFTGCEFRNFRFTDCVFQDCVIVSNRFIRCSARGNILDRCSVVGLIFLQIAPDGLGSPIESALNSTLKYCQFEKIDMPKCSFRNSDLIECTFTECDLSGCSFKECRFSGTDMSFCDLRKADFRNARGYCVNLKTCKVAEAEFSFPEAIHLLDAYNIKIE